MTVARLGREMSAAEMTEWQALYRLEAAERKEYEQRAELEARSSAGITTLRRRARHP